jgi:hypothetical protein
MWRAGELAHPPPMIAAPFAHHMASDWQAAASVWTQLGCPYERAVALADGDEAAQRAALEIFVQYDAPDPEAIRRAAQRNNLPVDRIIEVSVLDPYFYK